ncbi:uncharacterized protein LOC122629157 [Vespula pensylvanica]|uniref:uncharacterized protein LOC122629157 n=1 Tax=Vespula pensylvanica TaxID=30213 RepID=UPI001CBA1851|nr:uncharacterized protein LOC122629157 [Vespula pensylvanica]
MDRKFPVDIARCTLLQRLLLVAVDKRHGYSGDIRDTVASRYSQISTSKRQLSTDRSSTDSIPYEIPSKISEPIKTLPKIPLVAKIRPEDRPMVQTVSKKEKNEGIDEILTKWNVHKKSTKK